MEKILSITAISGWAIPKSWFAEQIKNAFPKSRVEVVYPENPEDFEEARDILNRFPSQLYIGYSLGSLWLLKYQDFLPEKCVKALLAPILSFLDNGLLGGKTTKTQLKYLIRILRSDGSKTTALHDFFFHAELPYPEVQMEDIPDRKVLLNGLEFLKNCSVTGIESKKFLSIVGENDIFLDAESLKVHIPHLMIVKDAGHSPGALLNHLAKSLVNSKRIHTI